MTTATPAPTADVTDPIRWSCSALPSRIPRIIHCTFEGALDAFFVTDGGNGEVERFLEVVVGAEVRTSYRGRSRSLRGGRWSMSATSRAQ